MERTKILVITGPTASGKSGLAIRLARQSGGEIVSADAMQIYRNMNIGTAKASLAERALVPHHLIDIVDPDDSFSTALYAQYANQAINDIIQRGKLPILCGGTGLYIESVLYHMQMGTPPDPAFRKEMEAYSSEQLHAKLTVHDPESAKILHPNDKKRIIRALEIFVSGTPASKMSQGFRKERQPRYNFIEWAIRWPRDILYQRIDQRVDDMMAQGLLDEVKQLTCYDRSLPALQGIGYKELLSHLNGETSLSEAIDAIKQGSRRYAKRQITWFSRDDQVKWLDGESLLSKKISEFGYESS